MEIEELKNTWQQMSSQIEKQKELNNKMILDMTKLKFSNKIKTIANFEGLGAIILFITLCYFIFNIKAFDTLPLQICAFVSISIMTILPILSLSTIYRMNSINLSNTNQKSTLIEFTKRRSQFLLVQKWGIGLSAIFMFTIMPLAMKLGSGKDFFADGNNNILWFAPIGIILLLLFARWGYNCYSKITNDAANLLNDLEEN